MLGFDGVGTGNINWSTTNPNMADIKQNDKTEKMDLSVAN